MGHGMHCGLSGIVHTDWGRSLETATVARHVRRVRELSSKRSRQESVLMETWFTCSGN